METITIPQKDLIEDMMYMSARYSIGRSSIGCQMLPGQMCKFILDNEMLLKNNINILLDDIVREINWKIVQCSDIRVDQSLTKDINIMNIVLEFLRNHPKGNDEFIHIYADGKIQLEKLEIENNRPVMDFMKIVYCWNDLVNALRPTFKIHTRDDKEYEGFLSLSQFDTNVHFKVAEDYRENPFQNKYINNDWIVKYRYM